MDATQPVAPNLTVRRRAVRAAAPSTAPVPRGLTRARGPAARSVSTSPPSVRGTVLAVLGAIASLGCAAAIGLISIAGPSAPSSPHPHQPVSTVQAHPRR